MQFLTALVENFWFWIMGLPVLIGACYGLGGMIMKHRERMAMIEHGIHPDDPRYSSDARARPSEQPATKIL